MKKHNILRGTLTFLGFTVLASSLYAADEIRIGSLKTASGQYLDVGISATRGIELAIEEINEAGGLLGKKVALVVRDDEFKKELAETMTKELIDKEKAIVVIGTGGATDMGNVAGPICNEKKVLCFSTSSSGNKVNDYFKDGVKENYAFRLTAPTSVLGPVMVREVVRVRSIKSVGILTVDSGNGKSAAKIFVDELEKQSIKPVYQGTFKNGDKDMTPQLTEARKAGAEALLVHGLAPEFAEIAHSMSRMKWKVDLIGSSIISGQEYSTLAGKDGEGTTMVTTFLDAETSNPIAKKFIKKFHDRYKEDPMAIAYVGAQAYDFTHLLKLAVQQAGSTDGPKVREALENLKTPYDGVLGKFIQPFSATDHEGIREQHIKIGVIKRGKPVFVTK